MTLNEYQAEYARLERWLKAWQKLAYHKKEIRLQSKQDRLECKCLAANAKLRQHYFKFQAQVALDLDERQKIKKAVEAFAEKMLTEMLQKQTDGFTGWDTLTPTRAQQLLDAANKKGDPVDVANFAMMLDYCSQRSAA